MSENNFPKLHNAMWPGIVGKGDPGGDPFIGLDDMLAMTARSACAVQTFEVAFSRRICCSRVCSERR